MRFVANSSKALCLLSLAAAERSQSERPGRMRPSATALPIWKLPKIREFEGLNEGNTFKGRLKGVFNQGKEYKDARMNEILEANNAYKDYNNSDREAGERWRELRNVVGIGKKGMLETSHDNIMGMMKNNGLVEKTAYDRAKDKIAFNKKPWYDTNRLVAIKESGVGRLTRDLKHKMGIEKKGIFDQGADKLHDTMLKTGLAKETAYDYVGDNKGKISIVSGLVIGSKGASTLAGGGEKDGDGKKDGDEKDGDGTKGA